VTVVTLCARICKEGDWIADDLIRIDIDRRKSAFLFIGWGKFAGGTEWVGIFQQIGFGQWFRFFTGVVEMLGGLLVLIPQMATGGYALLAVTMALAGNSVCNSAGDDLGKIDEIMIHIPSGRAAYAVLSFGGYLRMGNKLFACHGLL
jgi:uncharacterized membrane protein YphA (DoxX/SURF4 family)